MPFSYREMLFWVTSSFFASICWDRYGFRLSLRYRRFLARFSFNWSSLMGAIGVPSYAAYFCSRQDERMSARFFGSLETEESTVYLAASMMSPQTIKDCTQLISPRTP